MYHSDLNSPRQELSNRGPEIVVALLVRWQIILCLLMLDVQSSCIPQLPDGSLNPLVFPRAVGQIKGPNPN